MIYATYIYLYNNDIIFYIYLNDEKIIGKQTSNF